MALIKLLNLDLDEEISYEYLGDEKIEISKLKIGVKDGKD